MKKARSVRTSWASLRLTEHGQALVGVKGDGAPQCLYFASLEQLAAALAQKSLVVRKWAVAAPRALCIVKSVSLPAADLEEAAGMMEFEVPTLVPLAADEVVYGCTLAGRQEHLLNVLVYIIKADALERYLEPYKAAGVEPQRVLPDVLAIHGWFLRAEDHGRGPHLFVLADSSSCHLVVSRETNFQGSRVLHLGTDLEASAREIVQEIRDQERQIAAAPEEPLRVVLTGPPALVAGVQARLRTTDEGARTLEVTVVSGPALSPAPGETAAPDGADGPTVAAVIAAGLLGLSADPKPSLTNLVPRAYLAKEQRRLLLTNGLWVGVLSVVLVSLMWGCLGAANRRLSKTCALLRSQITPIEEVAGGVDRKRQRLRAIQRQLSNRGRIAETVAELYECTPKDISISQLDVTWKQDAMSVDIKGQTDLLPTAFEYTNAVRAALLLRAMQIVNAQQIPRPAGGSVVEFTAHCSVTGETPGRKP